MNAPLIVFAYRRLEHLKRCLASLETACRENGEQTKLYLFADGFKSEADRDEVLAVHEFAAHYACGCYSEVIPVLSQKNKGLAASVIEGVSDVIAQYGCAIVVEDDLTVSPGFMQFMNQALDRFEPDQRVWSVGGWVPELNSISGLKTDLFLSYRAECWGWATWKDRWVQVDWNVDDYRRFRYSVKARRKFSRGGSDMPLMLDAQMEGRIHSWAIRWAYSGNRHHMLTVCPKFSFVRNEGFDGSGTNCHDRDEDAELCRNFVPDFAKGAELNRRVIREYYRLVSGGLFKRTYRRFKSLLHRIRYDGKAMMRAWKK